MYSNLAMTSRGDRTALQDRDVCESRLAHHRFLSCRWGSRFRSQTDLPAPAPLADDGVPAPGAAPCREHDVHAGKSRFVAQVADFHVVCRWSNGHLMRICRGSLSPCGASAGRQCNGDQENREAQGDPHLLTSTLTYRIRRTRCCTPECPVRDPAPGKWRNRGSRCHTSLPFPICRFRSRNRGRSTPTRPPLRRAFRSATAHWSQGLAPNSHSRPSTSRNALTQTAARVLPRFAISFRVFRASVRFPRLI